MSKAQFEAQLDFLIKLFGGDKDREAAYLEWLASRQSHKDKQRAQRRAKAQLIENHQEEYKELLAKRRRR